MNKVFICILISIFLWACNTTKNIPEGKFLLNDFAITSDNKEIDKVLLEDYIRQKPNSAGKIRLGVYNMAGDTSKWINRFIQKLGQPPVIYSAQLAKMSASQIERQLSNQGYLNVKVDTLLKLKGKEEKKMSVTYRIISGTPYRIRTYEHKIDDPDISRILSFTKRFTSVKQGTLFDQDALEIERERMNNILRNFGYYSFSKENLYYKADTTLNSHQVDVFLSLRQTPDSTSFKRYLMRNITIVSGYDVTSDDNKENFANPDTTYKSGITIIHGKNKFLRNSMLLRNNYLQPGKYYSDSRISRTYTALSSNSTIKQTSIDLKTETEDSINYVDARINIAPSNTHWFQTGIDGTNSAGDFGIAPSISYQHQNLFNGAEILNLKLKGAYEFINGKNKNEFGNKNYYEYGADASLSFPLFLFPWMKSSWREIPTSSTQVSVGVNNQHRSEYIRQFFNMTYTFRWSTQKAQLSHALDLFDINYVRMPWTSSSFKESLDKNKVLKSTYDNQLIARSGYTITYTKNRGMKYPRNNYTIRGTVDVAGWLPHLVQSLGGLKENNSGQYEVMGIAYAEYVKTDLSFSHTRLFDKQKSFAYHILLGVAKPFSNSNILPYERRYFSGGANSVRGWSTRELGPGSYQSNDSTTFINQAGDIKLDMSIEYRNKISELFELAAFIDGGNIWTIKNYDGQEKGEFKFSNFYKEIALAYGAGLRVDLSFLLLRFDVGSRIYDPGRNEGDRFVMFKPRLSRMAWHFAIGYPY